ncbi:MAG TPA: vanadium-dependent haloperoxidase [Solirubrobacteraceae bacterium]|nr:vanadium-dependent haloperoxidase [Solirubrobacteraceae bacterium]
MSTRSARRCAVAAVAVMSTMLLSAPARADTVTQWNQFATNALVADGQGSSAVVHLAMVHAAMYDAVNAIDQRYEPYLVQPAAQPWYSQDAAAATAAYRVLVDAQPAVVQPVHQADLVTTAKALYDASLAAIPDGAPKDGGIATGNAAADAMLAARLNDGRFGPFRFTVGTLPGEWRPVLPAFVNDPFAWVKDVKPFLIRRSSQFGGPPPYPLTSRRYAREFDEVKELGALNSATRTQDQTDAGRFWGATNAVGTWGNLYRDIAQRYGRSLADNARMFAMLYLAGADAAITVWADKAKYSFWRPITAIREADTDGNARTTPDPNWLPLVNTPPYPDMPSGLSSLSGASARTLQDFFGADRLAFGTTNAVGITRSYASFSQAEEDVVNARVWSGIHFRHADEVGAAIGERIARWQEKRALQPAGHGHGHDCGNDAGEDEAAQ